MFMNILESISHAYKTIFESQENPWENELKDLSKFLDTYKSPTKMIRYCQEKFGPLIGKGSSRAVFKLDDTHILKVTLYNTRFQYDRGVDQNQIEWDVSKNNWYPDIVVHVIDVEDEQPTNDGGRWLIAEKAITPIKPKEFEELTDVKWKEFQQVIEYADNVNHGRRMTKPVNYEKYDDNDFVNSVRDMMGNYDMPSGDITSIRHWGKVYDHEDNSEEARLIDYGLNRNVFNKYYKR